MAQTLTADERDRKQHPEKYFDTPIGHIRDRIIINESLDIPKEGQFISLNGYPFLARPGVEIDLPRPVRLMLDTRIKTETIQGEDGKSHTRDIPRITYRLVAEDVGREPLPKDLNPVPAQEVTDFP